MKIAKHETTGGWTWGNRREAPKVRSGRKTIWEHAAALRIRSTVRAGGCSSGTHFPGVR